MLKRKNKLAQRILRYLVVISLFAIMNAFSMVIWYLEFALHQLIVVAITNPLFAVKMKHFEDLLYQKIK
jgi:hypothetical protein